MSRIPCNVNKDLLPLYVDEVCSGESRELVEEHLAGCGECQKYYAALKEGISEKRMEDKGDILSEEKLRQASVSIIKETKKQISKKQAQAAAVGVAAAVLMIIFVFKGMDGSYIGTWLGKIPLFDPRLKVSDMHVTELYQLENGYLYITVESEEKYNMMSCGNLNEARVDKSDEQTGEYEGAIELVNKWWENGLGIKNCSFVFQLSGKVENEDGIIEGEDSAIYLQGKGDERVKVWEKGQTVKEAPPEIEEKAKAEMELEDMQRRQWESKEQDSEPYMIVNWE